MASIMYCWREDVKTALDVAATSRTNAQIDREIAAASESIDKTMRRSFAPTTATRTFDWPDHQFALTWRLWLNSNELAAPPTQVLSAGVDITSSVLARNHKGDVEPPYTYLEIDLSTNATFASASTYQRAVSVTGVFGYSTNENPGGTITSAISSTTATTGVVSDSTLVGVGAILRIDAERVIVTGKNMVDTGQQSQLVLPAANNANTIQVPNGALINAGETIMLDAEKMRVDEIAGNILVVTRPWDGSVLAAHDANTEIYAPRQLTLARAQLGTTAATHAANAPVNVHAVPQLIRTLAVGETMARFGLEKSGYAMVITRGEMTKLGVGLPELWQQAKDSYQRKIRTRTAARSI